MARPVKEGPIRQAQILDAAQDLFARQGYEATTINDLLAAVKLSKGAFYYHFRSKEEVLDAMIQRRADEGIAAAAAIARSDALGPAEKLLAIMLAKKPDTPARAQLNDVLNQPANALLHQKALTIMTRGLTPILAGVVEEGIAQGLFSTPFPAPSVTLLLAGALTVFDDAYFRWSADEAQALTAAFLTAAERIFGAEAGSLAGLAAVFDTASDPESPSV
jgi:AcrR family transcriptional regulator